MDDIETTDRNQRRPLDGGKANLAGLLYQAIVTYGLKARSHSLESLENETEYEELLSVVGQGRIIQELADADSVVEVSNDTGEMGYALIQYKYSFEEAKPNLQPQTLRNIADSFIRNKKGISARITHYFLVTNRELSPEAPAYLKRIRDGEIPARTTGDQADILKRLAIITKVSLNKYERELRLFACRFGASERDTDEGIRKLIGDLLSRARGEEKWIDIETLKHAFTDIRTARELTPNEIAKISWPSLERAKSELDITLPQQSVWRDDILQQINDACSQNRALVFIIGPGGCGKTMALWTWAAERTRAQPPERGAFTAISRARSTSECWLTEVVYDWLDPEREQPTLRSQPPDVSIRRLLIANPDLERPLLHLALDGLDEGVISREDEIRKITKWFWEEDKRARIANRPPDATLVVTCRPDVDKGVESTVSKWISEKIANLPDPIKDQPPIVLVDIFTDTELRAAARGSLQGELREAINQALALTIAGLGDLIVADDAPVPLNTTTSINVTADPEIVQALRHPAMWRCFLDLSSLVQSRILRGELAAINELAQAFVDWFCQKTETRLPPHRSTRMVAMLAHIARHCRSLRQGPLERHKDWITPLDNAMRIGLGAWDLYDEALSAGLIAQRAAGYWYWRHPFVGDYLEQINVP
jgi:hypothetical protein